MKVGRTNIIGLDKMQDSDLILGFLKAVKRDTNLRFPNEIIFKKMQGGGKAMFRGGKRKMMIAANNYFNDSLFTIIHELVHLSGHWHHKRSFWRSFFNNCLKMNLTATKEHIHYKSGRNYFNKLQIKKGLK